MPDSPTESTAPRYPGRALSRRDTGPLVELVQRRLVELGFLLEPPDGRFGSHTDDAVRRFQAASVDDHGQLLSVDGRVGPITWASLFGSQSIPVAPAPESPVTARALALAAGEVGVREVPPGSNAGPRVTQYLASVGLGPGQPWCAAFVYYCFQAAATDLGVPNPALKTGSVQMLWRLARERNVARIDAEDALDDPSRIHPGMVFLVRTGDWTGHTGFVEAVNGGWLTTIEGNSNDAGGREGIGVFRRSRKLATVTLGFISYGGGSV